jgi:hypothetical protein
VIELRERARLSDLHVKQPALARIVSGNKQA